MARTISELAARAAPILPASGLSGRIGRGLALPIPSFGSNLSSTSRASGGCRLNCPLRGVVDSDHADPCALVGSTVICPRVPKDRLLALGSPDPLVYIAPASAEEWNESVKDKAQRTSEVFDEYEGVYSDTVNRSIAFTGMNVDFFTKVKADYILDLCRDAFDGSHSLNVLDIGCGIGNFHPILAPRFGALTGVDISAGSIEKARQRNPSVNYRVYDGEHLPFAEGTFDVAFTVCVMHHIEPGQWRSFAGEMHRVVRRGGMALVFEHNPRNPLTLRAVNNCPFDEDAVLLRSETTAGLLSDVGFNKVDTRFILSVPAAGWLMQTLDRGFSRLPWGAQYYIRAGKSSMRSLVANRLLSKLSRFSWLASLRR